MTLEVEADERAQGKWVQRQPYGIGSTEVKHIAIRDMRFYCGCNDIENCIGREAEVLLAAKILDYEYVPLNDTDEILWK